MPTPSLQSLIGRGEMGARMRSCDRSATAPPRRDGRPQSRGPLGRGGERHEHALLGHGLRTPLARMWRSTGLQAPRPAVSGNGGALDRKRPEDAGIDERRVKPVDGGRRRELPSV